MPPATPPLPPIVLLVDDDATARFLSRRLLHKHWPGVQVQEAANGEEGLVLVQAHCQATQAAQSLLILLDLNMPVLDGFGFLERFQQLGTSCQQSTAVIVCSSSTNTQDVARVRLLAGGHLPKPLTAANLEQLLCQHLPAAVAA